jgi:hypothetical protein
MGDGETPLENANNNPAIVKVRFSVKGGSLPPITEKLDVADIDIGGKIVIDKDTKQKYILFTINNTAYYSDLNGIMIKFPVKYFPNYDSSGLNKDNISVENGNYVWKFSQMLARREGEQITIKCPSNADFSKGFNFYTYDGKTKICACIVKQS